MTQSMTPRSHDVRRFAVATGAMLILSVAGVAGSALAQPAASSRGLPVYGGRILAPGERVARMSRPGPPGSYVLEIDQAPTCLVAMQRGGFNATRVSCPNLATKPGLTTQCIGSDGRRTASAISTFVDYDPVTGHASTDCYLKSVIGG